MQTGHYTRLRGRTTVFRRKIPAHLRSQFESSEICLTLGVINNDSAKRLGRRLAVAVDALFDEAASTQSMNDTELKQVLASTLAEWSRTRERQQAEEALERKERHADPRFEAENLGVLADAIVDGHAKHLAMYGHDFIAERFRAAGFEVSDDPIDLEIAARRTSLLLALDYYRTAITIAERHDLGHGRKHLPVSHWCVRRDALMRELLPEIGSIPFVTSAPMPQPGVAEASPQASRNAAHDRTPVESGALFSEVFDKSVEDRIKLGRVKPGYRREVGASRRLWIEICGDRPLGSYGRADVSKFRSTLVEVPRMYWRSEAEREKPIDRIIREAKARAKRPKGMSGANGPDATGGDNPGYERISNVSINKLLSAIGPFFRWAIDNGHLPEDTPEFWTRFHLPTGEAVTGLAENEERVAFSLDAIRRIFVHPVWTGRRNHYFYNRPGKLIVRDSLYWAPLVAAHSMMRREEITQLKVKHVRQEQGHWVFDLKQSDLSLKRPQSRRLVPLHDNLIKLGFVETMVVGRNLETQLFSELTPSETTGKFGDLVGKQFARVLENVGIELVREDGSPSAGVFHPFRHFGETVLLNAGVSQGLVDALAGHKSAARDLARAEIIDRESSEAARYMKGYYIENLKAAINKLELPIDVDRLKALADKHAVRPRPVRRSLRKA